MGKFTLLDAKDSGAKGLRTLLQLLGRYQVPDGGGVIFPGSWRVRFIDAFPRLTPGTFFDNLVFGVQYPGRDGIHPYIHTETEVLALCAEIGLGNVKPQLKDRLGHGGMRFSNSVRVLISIARALLSSPQILLIAGGLDPLGPDGARRVIDVLRTLLQKKGLPTILRNEYSLITHERLRRPCAVFITTRVPEIKKLLDKEELCESRDLSGIFKGEDVSSGRISRSPSSLRGPTRQPSYGAVATRKV